MKALTSIVNYTVLVFLVMISPFNQLFGTNYEIGDSLNVYAKSGLNIRSEANSNGEKIKLIPFGHKIKIIDTKNFELRDTIERLPGNWVEISYLGIHGFVFDGYLSKLSIPVSSQKTKDLFFDLRSYIKENYEKKFEVSTHEPCDDPDGKVCNHGQLITTYDENIVHAVAVGWESGTDNFHFRNTRFAEIINLLLLFVDKQTPLFKILNRRVNTNNEFRKEIKFQKEGFSCILAWDEKDCLIKLSSWVYE